MTDAYKKTVLKQAALAQEAIEQGMFVEVGWEGCKAEVFSHLPPEQQARCRLAFLVGAQHMFAMLGSILAVGEDDKPSLESKFVKIATELQRMHPEYKAAKITNLN